MIDIYELDADGQELVQSARELARSVLVPAAAGVDTDARFPEECIRALGEQGFLGLCIDTQSGGQGQPPRVFAAVVEELAQACASTAMIYVMHVTATGAIANSSLSASQGRLLEDIAAGNHLTTIAFSERGSRSQFWAPVSALRKHDSETGWTISAEKAWVTSAGHADSFVSSAQRTGAESPMESTLFLVRREQAGVSIGDRFDGLGLRGNDSTPVILEDVSVATDHLLSAQGAGTETMLTKVLPWFLVGTAAMANGLCRAAVRQTADHLAEAGFENNGSKLRDLPTLRARLAEMSVRTEQSRALLSTSVRSLDEPQEETPLYLLQSRLAAVEAGQHVTELAMLACGGAAFSKHLPIERMFRDARAGCVMAPTADHLREFIGRATLGLSLF